MKQFWLSFFGTVAGVITAAVLFCVFIVFAIAGLIASAVQDAENASQTALPSGAVVLELDLRAPRLDQPGLSPFLFAQPLSVTELGLTLDRAAADDQVEAVFVRANPLGMSPGQAEEIRRALARFQASGKPVVAHAQGFEGPAVANYFAVSGADEIWLQDTASFSATGYATETVFFGDLIEQTGAQAEFLQFYEYKSAADPFVSNDYTEAHREATLSWLGSLFDTAVEAAAEDRGIEADRMRALIEQGPYTAERAVEAGLADRLGHLHAARDSALAHAGDGARFVAVEEYARARPARQAGGAVIALIGGEGPIETGAGEAGFAASAVVGSDRLSAAIDAAAEDSQVRAIVLRVESPGGSAIASDQIWDSVVRARAAGKPVVVSMGAVAASGGYYIAAPADRIVANASTLTGSIGVVAGKIVIDGALQRIGVNIEPLSVGGEYATAFSSSTAWTESQRAAFESLAADTYADFTERVAEGRDLPLQRVQEIARGRVWTGAQALELGLVDRIGGLAEAVEEARDLAGIAPGEDVTLKRFPRRPAGLEAFQELFGLTAEGVQALGRLDAVLALPEVQAMLEARASAEHGGVRLESRDAADGAGAP
ncbi:MAG: signal peptide peptidase SppA [Oceanicaulis sp.]